MPRHSRILGQIFAGLVIAILAVSVGYAQFYRQESQELPSVEIHLEVLNSLRAEHAPDPYGSHSQRYVQPLPSANSSGRPQPRVVDRPIAGAANVAAQIQRHQPVRVASPRHVASAPMKREVIMQPLPGSKHMPVVEPKEEIVIVQPTPKGQQEFAEPETSQMAEIEMPEMERVDLPAAAPIVADGAATATAATVTAAKKSGGFFDDIVDFFGGSDDSTESEPQLAQASDVSAENEAMARKADDYAARAQQMAGTQRQALKSAKITRQAKSEANQVESAQPEDSFFASMMADPEVKGSQAQLQEKQFDAVQKITRSANAKPAPLPGGYAIADAQSQAQARVEETQPLAEPKPLEEPPLAQSAPEPAQQALPAPSPRQPQMAQQSNDGYPQLNQIEDQFPADMEQIEEIPDDAESWLAQDTEPQQESVPPQEMAALQEEAQASQNALAPMEDEQPFNEYIIQQLKTEDAPAKQPAAAPPQKAGTPEPEPETELDITQPDSAMLEPAEAPQPSQAPEPAEQINQPDMPELESPTLEAELEAPQPMSAAEQSLLSAAEASAKEEMGEGEEEEPVLEQALATLEQEEEVGKPLAEEPADSDLIENSQQQALQELEQQVAALPEPDPLPVLELQELPAGPQPDAVAEPEMIPMNEPMPEIASEPEVQEIAPPASQPQTPPAVVDAAPAQPRPMAAKAAVKQQEEEGFLPGITQTFTNLLGGEKQQQAKGTAPKPAIAEMPATPPATGAAPAVVQSTPVDVQSTVESVMPPELPKEQADKSEVRASGEPLPEQEIEGRFPAEEMELASLDPQGESSLGPAKPALPTPDLNLTYGPDDTDIPDPEKAKLAELAQQAKANNRRVYITSFASGTPAESKAANMISLSRGLSLRAFFIDEGVEMDRIIVQAKGLENEGGVPDRAEIRLE